MKRCDEHHPVVIKSIEIAVSAFEIRCHAPVSRFVSSFLHPCLNLKYNMSSIDELRGEMRTLLLVVMLASSMSTAIARPQRQSSRQHPRRHKQQIRKSQSHSRMNAGPIAPPEQLRPPPLVQAVYQEGALSITAEDATLREIFDSVRQSTGAAIDAPASEERMSVHLGPQAPVQVIAALLEGTPFNYAILGGTGPADRVLRIIVVPKPVGAPPASLAKSEEAAARVRAKTHRVETGGDEGAWDNNEPEAPAQPATAPLPPQRAREHR